MGHHVRSASNLEMSRSAVVCFGLCGHMTLGLLTSAGPVETDERRERKGLLICCPPHPPTRLSSLKDVCCSQDESCPKLTPSVSWPFQVPYNVLWLFSCF